ncbi:MAG: TIGR02453 family protein, partial [Acidobacteriota bacterium]
RQISPHIQAIPKAVGGSLFRIYRDVRFSKDKRPYKTHVGIHFRHASGKDAHAPGFYLHLEPGQVFLGAGIWRPESKVLKQIRAAIDEEPAAWLAMKDELGPGLNLAGESLKTSPRGYGADHPMIDDLRRKDFFTMVELEEGAAVEPGFQDVFLDHCRRVSPLAAYLCRVLDVPF